MRLSNQSISMLGIMAAIVKRTCKPNANQVLFGSRKRRGCGQVMMCQQIEPASKNSRRKQECKLPNVEKCGSGPIDQQRVIRGEGIGIVAVQQFDAEKQEAGATNERILFPIGGVVFEKVCGNYHDTLYHESQQENKQDPPLRIRSF